MVLFFTLLKAAKENVKEKEESTERPGQTECKVSLLLLLKQFLSISILMNMHFLSHFLLCQWFYWYELSFVCASCDFCHYQCFCLLF